MQPNKPRIRFAEIHPARWLAKIFSKLLCFVGIRPIVFLDSDLAQLDWIGVPRLEIAFAGVRYLKPILFYRSPLAVDNKKNVWGASCRAEEDLRFIYRGVDLFQAAEYLICVSLEISRHELNLNKPSHRGESQKWLSLAKSLTDDLIAYLDKHKPRSVVIMQGYFIEAAIARQLADRFKFQVVSLENTFHPNRIICEPISGISVNNTSVMGWFHRLVACSSGRFGNDSQEWLKSIVSLKSQDHSSPAVLYSWPADRKRVLFLGQCLTDSSVLYASDRPYSTIEIIDYLMSFVLCKGEFLFVKMHPKEYGGTDPLFRPYGQLTYRKMVEAELVSRLSDTSCYVDSLNLYSTSQLIHDADVIVTINSQAGLEALVLGKEVVLLGQAFYDGIGCTWNIPELSMLGATLDAILIEGKSLRNKVKVDAFLHIYFERFCIEKNARDLIFALKHRQISRNFFS